MKEILLKDIEIDFEQLKCLINSLTTDHNPIMREAVKRNILQLQNRLEELYYQIDLSEEANISIEEQVVPKYEYQEDKKLEEVQDALSMPEEEQNEEELGEEFPTEEITHKFEVKEEEVTSEFEIEEEAIPEIAIVIENIVEEKAVKEVGQKKEEAAKNIPIPVISQIDHSSIREFITLNDKFRFARELFNEDTEKMNLVINEIDDIDALEDALIYISTVTEVDEESEAFIDFIEILQRHFNA